VNFKGKVGHLRLCCTAPETYLRSKTVGQGASRSYRR
jgi:hypothetical protein